MLASKIAFAIAEAEPAHCSGARRCGPIITGLEQCAKPWGVSASLLFAAAAPTTASLDRDPETTQKPVCVRGSGYAVPMGFFHRRSRHCQKACVPAPRLPRTQRQGCRRPSPLGASWPLHVPGVASVAVAPSTTMPPPSHHAAFAAGSAAVGRPRRGESHPHRKRRHRQPVAAERAAEVRRPRQLGNGGRVPYAQAVGSQLHGHAPAMCQHLAPPQGRQAVLGNQGDR